MLNLVNLPVFPIEKLNGSVCVCFLDASKAFDRVNHRTLFKGRSRIHIANTNLLVLYRLPVIRT